MTTNQRRKFDDLIAELKMDKKYELALQNGLLLYKIKPYNVQNLTPKKIVQMYYFLNSKFYYHKPSSDNQSWYQNELRVFVWLLIGYSYIQKKHISALSQADWEFFCDTFNRKNPETFQFQSRNLLKINQKSKWSAEEVSILDSLIKSKSIKNKWNEIARQLFIVSQKKYFRTAKQCREHWINHLNPVTLHTSWTTEEDLQLISAIEMYGKKWAKVSKSLGGKRTQHMVKNRFKSLYRLQSRKFGQEQTKGRERLDEKILKRLHEQLLENLENQKEQDKKESQENQIKEQYNSECERQEMSSLVNELSLGEEKMKKKLKGVELQEIEMDFSHYELYENSRQDCFNMFFNEYFPQ